MLYDQRVRRIGVAGRKVMRSKSQPCEGYVKAEEDKQREREEKKRESFIARVKWVIEEGRRRREITKEVEEMFGVLGEWYGRTRPRLAWPGMGG